MEAYEQGNFSVALREWRSLAENGHVMAQNKLGVMYDRGEGVLEDNAEAAKWYLKAAEQGLDLAQFSLGFMYDRGEGVLQNSVEAVKWYRKAAEQGNANAQAWLGAMYANGKGIPQDDVQAYAWLAIAVAQDFAPASEARDLVAQRMTYESRKGAQRLAQKYWEAYVLTFRN